MSKTQSPKSEGAYLIGPRVKKEAATKARKKIVRKGNIQKGSESAIIYFFHGYYGGNHSGDYMADSVLLPK